MAPGSPYRLRNTPKRSSKLLESLYADYRASPTPRTPRSRPYAKSRPNRGRTGPRAVDIESDADVIVSETDDDDQPSKNTQYRGGQIRDGRRRAPKASRMALPNFIWVVWDRIPGYVADDRDTQRRAPYWNYGVPIRYKRDTSQWYLCISSLGDLDQVSQDPFTQSQQSIF
ncbi:hypothetical protein EJ04DRAFT_567563 [Polyplosphaeria fusca]|uniref:Uncharacterized protein n=1 Tax=Polyplosphaeria fusca TaxID=682080 RepID=A0A9P4QNE3_9PLEO|nr:hypothetical protein EJ04DRAFT_567563 [Polyplosphaeria fusca]